jgi:HTH-type transcriptional regulator/antitoxin HipB
MILSDPAEFGEAVRHRRHVEGLTQEEVALSAGVGLRFVHDLERGKESIELGRAMRVAAVLGLELRAEARATDAWGLALRRARSPQTESEI